MGNKAQRLGISAGAPIGSADLKHMWTIYDSKKKGRLTREEARKFLKDLALAAEVEWDGAKADELVRMCGGEDGCLDYDKFENLLFSFAEERHGISLSHSMYSRQGMKKKPGAGDPAASNSPVTKAVTRPGPSASEPPAYVNPPSDPHAPMPPPKAKPKAGQANPTPAAFEVHAPKPAANVAAGPGLAPQSSPLEASVYDHMPPPKSPRPPSSDLTASRFEPMPLSLPVDHDHP